MSSFTECDHCHRRLDTRLAHYVVYAHRPEGETPDPPWVEDPAHFCGRGCLRAWLDTQPREEPR